MVNDETQSGGETRSILTGVAAGVPYVAQPPAAGAGTGAPVVIAWHLMDPPRTEAAFAAALPLEGLEAWRFYLGLPMFGSRTPAGGLEEVLQLAGEDAVLKLYEPVFDQALKEFEPALTELRGRFGATFGPIGLMGGSAGGAVAQLVLTESSVKVAAAVLVNPLVQLRTAVDAMSKHYGVTYQWSDKSQAVADRIDFVARANEIAQQGQPAIRIIVGEEDGTGFRVPAAELYEALARLYTDSERVSMSVIPGMAHALAEEPGIDPAPQTPHAAEVDRLAVEWFRPHIRS